VPDASSEATRAHVRHSLTYDWTFTDGTTATGPTVVRTYDRPGEYSEVLKVTDSQGNVDYDFAVVLILDRANPDRLPPTVHPAYAPTFGIRPGDAVTFKVRTFRTTDGEETWDFGDGSGPVVVKSDGNVAVHAKDGYAVTTHRFAQAGDYLVRVSRTDRHGITGIGHLHVRVEK
jgi:PKD repeat protein